MARAGPATTKRERIVADGRPTAVVRVRITDAGRQETRKDVQVTGILIPSRWPCDWGR